jgi:lysylphosphatidylglycerol synthetase-like protein (DUF2156 family)
MQQKRYWIVILAACITLGSGVLNIVSVVGPGLQNRIDLLTSFFPLGFVHVSRSLTLLLALAIIVIAVKLIMLLKAKGFTRFNLGMAPMSGFADHEDANREERIIHNFFQNLNFLFNYRGLKHFKSKYASSWEPRYTVYRSIVELPQIMMALGKISEIKTPRHH